MNTDAKRSPRRYGAWKSLEFSYMKCDDTVKAVIQTPRPVYDVTLTVGGTVLSDSFNDEEPFDRQTHVFYIPEELLSADTVLRLTLKKSRRYGGMYYYDFPFGDPVYTDGNKLLAEYDHGLEKVSKEREEIADGVIYKHFLYNDKDKAPVHVFLAKIDPAKAYIYVGTPGDGYKSLRVKATIPDMTEAAEKNGKAVAIAVNADFFDMFGDHHPSGLCVKNGVTVANPDSKRYFLASMKDGSHRITSLEEEPDILPCILHAAAGLQLIVKDGKINDFAPLEPFSYVRHPRTAVGIRKDGTVLLAVVDGRIPEYSNGASLVDLAKLMISYGADRALNVDGGGSSAMYTKNGTEHILRSRPADLVRPTAKLIRKDYNSFLAILK